MTESPIDRLREICLALPEAAERETWDAPTFRVRDKIFVKVSFDGGLPSIWCKASPGAQEVLTQADPGRFFVPPYLARHGWIGIRLDRPDWGMIEALVEDSYRLTAPKRLLARLSA